MAVGTRLVFPVNTAGNFLPEIVDNTALRTWDPSLRTYVLRDQMYGIANSRNYLGPASRQKFLSSALPRDGMRISLKAGLKTMNATTTAGSF
jgi:hypothetical protein